MAVHSSVPSASGPRMEPSRCHASSSRPANLNASLRCRRSALRAASLLDPNLVKPLYGSVSVGLIGARPMDSALCRARLQSRLGCTHLGRHCVEQLALGVKSSSVLAQAMCYRATRLSQTSASFSDAPRLRFPGVRGCRHPNLLHPAARPTR